MRNHGVVEEEIDGQVFSATWRVDGPTLRVTMNSPRRLTGTADLKSTSPDVLASAVLINLADEYRRKYGTSHKS